MATINIGSLTFTHKGDYASGTAYVKNDVVYYSTNGNAYIAKQGTTGNAPTNATYWNQFTQGSGGIWNSGLSLGSANQVVAVNSGANALEFQNAPSGSVPVVETFNNSAAFFSTQNQSHTDVTQLDTSITPSATSSKILIMVHLDHANDTFHYQSQFRIQRKIASGSFGQTVTNGYGAGDSQSSSRATRAEYDSNGGGTMFGTYVDAPNTTSAVTYRIQVKNSSGGGTLYLNRNSSNSSNSNHWQRAYACKVIAMELKQ